ncbi:MAG: sulfide/dihydroorotate dehydrogenase-like FAD/NAD-binding protein [Desulfobacteraceae bacterium]|nr:sulfide/dihydroorotate dehydrogenase-like FAD/NAD-binding protein [Desulfobacteraceae bacterium]
MAEILEKRLIRPPDVFYYRLHAPLVAAKAKPGQFVIIRIHEKGERIPLSLADINPSEGTISLIVMCVGKTTSELATLQEGERIRDVCGPLGNPTHIENVGRVVLAGGGFGVAPLYPIGRAFRDAGNRVVTIMGARSKGLLIYGKEMESVSHRVAVSTDDGSAGIKGIITDALESELRENGADLVMAVGPAPMMEAVCRKTASFGVRTIVSLNAVMVDGTGMCGGCRVRVAGETKFACMDGPDFDGSLVDWDLLIRRQKMYKAEEKESFEAWKKRHGF